MSVIDDIKQRLDIVDVVSDYVTLHKSGRNFKALCPFHTEKTPSFFVFPERQSWHCFGSCGVGGDMFSFIMKKEGIDFSEALRTLAQRAGVTLVKKEKAEDKGEERLYRANEAAAEYYHRLLVGAEAAEVARGHLAKRGILPQAIEDFQLGFSPDSWEALSQHLLHIGYKRDELLRAGLVIAREDGGVRDLFRNRLMIPIRNEQGRVAGFGARALDDSTPKYLNSPQTAVFDKSGILYGIDRAKGAIKEEGLAIIVEGYMDVIAAHQYGMKNVVASMGTSLTQKQVAMIKRLTTNLALALDADAAGDEATLRGLEVAREALTKNVDTIPDWLGSTSKLGGSLKIIHLPQGKDPDEVIRENPENWRRLVDQALPIMDYFFKAVASKFDLSKEGERAAVADQLLSIIAAIDDDVAKELYLRRLAQLVGVDERSLGRRAAKLRPTPREKPRKVVTPPSTQLFHRPVEEYCLSILLQHPELRDRGGELSPDYFESTENRELFLAWRDSADVESLRQRLDTSLWERLDSLVAREIPPARNKELETALADCRRRLKEQWLKRLKALEEMLISEAASEGDKNIIKERVETILRTALDRTVQLRDLFEEERRARRGEKQ